MVARLGKQQPPQRTRLAIATVQFYATNSTFGCGLIKWCRSAASFANGMPWLDAEAVVFTNAPQQTRKDCRAPRGLQRPTLMPYDPGLVRDVQRWGTALAAQPWHQSMGAKPGVMATLFKWEVLRHTEWEAVLLTDNDVDFFLDSGGVLPPESDWRAWRALNHAWRVRYPEFLRSEAQLVGTPDFHVPINTAVLLLKPNRTVYRIGRRTLQTQRFSIETGFNETGPPSLTLPCDQDGSGWGFLAHRAAATSSTDLVDNRWGSQATSLINKRTKMCRHNTWNFICGAGDQGLVAHVYLVMLRGRTVRRTSWASSRDQTWIVNHFFGAWPARATVREHGP